MKKKWTWIIILCIFNFSLMGFILTHPTPNSKEATKVVKNVSTKKQENKKSFTFVGVGDNLYHGAIIMVRCIGTHTKEMDITILIPIMK